MTNKLFKQRAEMLRYVYLVGVPCLTPGILISMVLQKEFGALPVVALAGGLSFYLLYKKWPIISTAQNFPKYTYISAALYVLSSLAINLVPERNNGLAGAILFVFLPSMLISSHLLAGSKSAKKLQTLIEES